MVDWNLTKTCACRRETCFTESAGCLSLKWTQSKLSLKHRADLAKMQASSSSSSRIHGKRWNLRLTGRKRGSLVGLEQARRGKVKGHGRSTSFMVHCSLGEDRHFHRGHYLYDIADFSAAEQHEQLVLGAPPRPRRIILVRHGQSEGNIDEGAYTRIPDSKISLTEAGWRQAIECGKRIRTLVESDGAPDWKVYFYVSPYRRSLQTLKAIGMAFERERIAGVREEPRLREQDFGNFQDQERMRVEKEIRLRYGRFFYRFPNGESAADVYDRITGFRETLRADIDIGRFQRPEDRSKNVNLVLVSHGLTLRVFLMRWYKWTVEQFEGLWNFGNTGTMVMETGPGGRYSLLVHHTREELKAFGMTECMIDDQEWQKYAKPGELNYDWLTSGSNFFSHFDSDKDELSQMPSEIKNASSMRDFFQPEPPVGWPS